MIGEGDRVQEVGGVVLVECAPAAICTLHALDPAGGAGDVLVITGAIDPVQQHAHHRGVVDIGIEVVAVLERPAARREIGRLGRPVALDIEDLPLRQPVAGGTIRGSAGSSPASNNAWVASAVSHTGDTQGWQ